jgi:hypothetical protein
MDIKTNLEGEHKGLRFAVNDGYLIAFGTKFTKQDLKHLIEISTLLTAQGHEIREKERRIKRLPSVYGIWNGEQPEYYDDEELEK